MCRIFEEYGEEIAAEARENARAETKMELVESLLRQGKLSKAEIADVSGVPLGQVSQLAEQVAAPALA